MSHQITRFFSKSGFPLDQELLMGIVDRVPCYWRFVVSYGSSAPPVGAPMPPKHVDDILWALAGCSDVDRKLCNVSAAWRGVVQEAFGAHGMSEWWASRIGFDAVDGCRKRKARDPDQDHASGSPSPPPPPPPPLATQTDDSVETYEQARERVRARRPRKVMRLADGTITVIVCAEPDDDKTDDEPRPPQGQPGQPGQPGRTKRAKRNPVRSAFE